jgi:hypothetical protein
VEEIDAVFRDAVFAIPARLRLPNASQLPPFSIVPGIKLTPFTGHFQTAINKFNKRITSANLPDVAAPTHLIVIRKQEYLRAFERRLVLDGISRGHEPIRFFDLNGLAQQVLVSLTLVAGVSWTVGGAYYIFRRELGTRDRYTLNNAGYRLLECIPDSIA